MKLYSGPLAITFREKIKHLFKRLTNRKGFAQLTKTKYSKDGTCENRQAQKIQDLRIFLHLNHETASSLHERTLSIRIPQ